MNMIVRRRVARNAKQASIKPLRQHQLLPVKVARPVCIKLLVDKATVIPVYWAHTVKTALLLAVKNVPRNTVPMAKRRAFLTVQLKVGTRLIQKKMNSGALAER